MCQHNYHIKSYHESTTITSKATMKAGIQASYIILNSCQHNYHIKSYHESWNTSKLPYTAKLSRGKIFAVVHKTHHSLENFRGASGPCHYVLYTANDSRVKLSRLAKKLRKPRKFSPSKVLPYTVYHTKLIGYHCY